MAKISVIVPVYNVEKYLDKCLGSLVKQTLKDIEIIVVNDGSPDNSQDIINKYIKKYKNVFGYKKKNGGLSSARNYGLKYATGEYIAFIDSDDYVDKSMMEKMYNKAISDNFDIVVCDLELVNESYESIGKVSSKICKDLYDNDVRKMLVDFYPVVCNKIYKRELFDNDLTFKVGVLYEDVEFMHRLIPYVNSIGVVGDNLYYYLQREGAITKTFDERLYHYVDNWNGILDFYNDRGFYEGYKSELEFCYVRYLYATFVKRATNFGDKVKYKEAVRVAIENVKNKFPKYRKNKYFYKSLKGIYLVLFCPMVANIYYKLANRRS